MGDVVEQIAQVGALIQQGDIVVFNPHKCLLFVWGTRDGKKLQILREYFPNIKNQVDFLNLVRKITEIAGISSSTSKVSRMPKRYWARRLL